MNTCVERDCLTSPSSISLDALLRRSPSDHRAWHWGRRAAPSTLRSSRAMCLPHARSAPLRAAWCGLWWPQASHRESSGIPTPTFQS